MRMRLFMILAFVLIVSSPAQGRTINILVWAEAFPDWVFNEFTRETGIKTNVSFFSSEDMLYQRLSQFPDNFDLVACSPSYVFQQLLQEGLVRELQRESFLHWNALNPQIKSNVLDPEWKYMLPYMWGSLLLAVNPEQADPELVSGYSDLWRPELQGRILLPDELRSIFSFTLLTLGFSPNDQDQEHGQQVMNKLILLLNNNTVISTNYMLDLIEGRVAAAVSWNGSILEAVQANPKLRVIEPEEGDILWFDGFFIPAQARNPADAYAFLNYIFKPEICARLTQDTFYATTNLEAQALLPDAIAQNRLMRTPCPGCWTEKINYGAGCAHTPADC